MYRIGNVHLALPSKSLRDYTKMWEPINLHKNVILFCLFTELVITALHEKQDRWGEHVHLLTHKRLGRPTKRTRCFQSNKNPWLRYIFYCCLKSMAKFQKNNLFNSTSLYGWVWIQVATAPAQTATQEEFSPTSVYAQQFYHGPQQQIHLRNLNHMNISFQPLPHKLTQS